MLLSLADSPQKSEGLRFRTPADCACVSDAVTAAFDHWAPRWAIGRSDETRPFAILSASGDLSSLVDVTESDWKVLDVRKGTGIWWTFPTKPEGLDIARVAHGVLLRRLFNDVPDVAPKGIGKRVADELAEAAWADWCLALHDQLCGPAGDAGQIAYSSLHVRTEGFRDAARIWSGALLVAVHWCGVEMRLLLSGDAVESLTKRTPERQKPSAAGIRIAGPRVTPVLHAVTDNAVTLRVELNPLEIDLGALCSLKTGDVLLSGHCLDEALSVRLAPSGDEAASKEVCHGFLGRLGERMAVELQPSTSQAS